MAITTAKILKIIEGPNLAISTGEPPRKTTANMPSMKPPIAKIRCGLSVRPMVPCVNDNARPVAKPAMKCKIASGPKSWTPTIAKGSGADAEAERGHPTPGHAVKEGRQNHAGDDHAEQEQGREAAGLRGREGIACDQRSHPDGKRGLIDHAGHMSGHEGHLRTPGIDLGHVTLPISLLLSCFEFDRALAAS